MKASDLHLYHLYSYCHNGKPSRGYGLRIGLLVGMRKNPYSKFKVCKFQPRQIVDNWGNVTDIPMGERIDVEVNTSNVLEPASMTVAWAEERRKVKAEADRKDEEVRQGRATVEAAFKGLLRKAGIEWSQPLHTTYFTFSFDNAKALARQIQLLQDEVETLRSQPKQLDSLIDLIDFL